MVVAVVSMLFLSSDPGAQHRVDVMLARGGLAAHIAASFAEPIAFQRTSGGDSYVFDRREHAVHRIDAQTGEAQQIVRIGQSSLFFESRRRVLVTPGCYEFDVR